MGKKLLPPTYLYLAIVAMLAFHFLIPVAKIITSRWRFFGVIPILLGLALNLLADQAFKKHRTTVKPFEESSSLITSGVFRLSRHPMYLGFVLFLLGLAISLGSFTPYAVVAVFPILMEILFIGVEERMLEERFGVVWLEYKGRVRKWV